MTLMIKCPRCGHSVLAPDLGLARCDNCGWLSGNPNPEFLDDHQADSLKLLIDKLNIQNKVLIEALKPFAFSWQNVRTREINWKDCYRAQLLLIDIMGKDRYLKEAKDAL